MTETNFKNVVIEGMAYALPSEIYSSKRIEEQLNPLYKRLNLPQGRLELMTGIKERRFWPSSHRPSEASAKAGRNLLAKGIKKEEVDLLIHSSVCRDRLEPATASYVHRLLGLSGNTQILDISNACLGFINAIILAAGMIESGQIKRAMIVAGENGKPLVDKTIKILNQENLSRKDIKPFFANLTIGAGAVAWSIAHKDLLPKNCPRLGSFVCETDTSHNHLCEGDSSGDELVMQTDSEALLHAGISVAHKAWSKFTKSNDIQKLNPDLIVTHQVGKVHTKAVFEALKLPLDKNYSTFENLGNCGSVSLPLTYTHACEKFPSMLEKPAVLLGIGSGLSSIMLSINP
ncbi:MAG: 3-oxoacyl-ACP synthase III [Opitutae bacterium]|nr:3-oxoacyl-ACP synthase III [Opitutae bacterium]